MEKKTVLSLVRAHVEHDEKAFIEKATKLAEELEQDGDWKTSFVRFRFNLKRLWILS